VLQSLLYCFTSFPEPLDVFIIIELLIDALEECGNTADGGAEISPQRAGLKAPEKPLKKLRETSPAVTNRG
jgi:hypothetical protein